ncbi:Dyp-type peroxidase [Nocardioides sp. URHA0020]|uniref:Dyp-type peroxidase n=1 Tax=Nocardioides sp. URHA0020 TaxID=1380392 RepID=UPI0006869D30|nr:Dyp-type peroxidase [Nocardioides sp. URHA0020]
MILPEPQAVTSPLTRAAVFLVLTIEPGGEGVVRELLADVQDMARAIGFRNVEASLSCVVGIGSDAYDRVYGGPRPAGLHPFAEIRGERHVAPATPGDVFLHIKAEQLDLCFELAARLTQRLRGAAVVVDEVHGFRYFDRRDLLGFVDGTENPVGPAVGNALLVGDDDPDFAGGSYVVIQKYLHDLTTWNAMTVEQQEAAVGREKLSDIELPDAEKSPGAHTALTSIEDEDGTELEILRDNMPFGSVAGGPDGGGEYGTYFVGYTRDPAVIERMLRNMFVGDPPGVTDHLLEVSTAVTGSLYFVPTVDQLEG